MSHRLGDASLNMTLKLDLRGAAEHMVFHPLQPRIEEVDISL